MPPVATTTATRATPAQSLRVVTYNIHKGVQGVWPMRRLEIHNLQHAIAHLDADIICLQEVRKHNRREAKVFDDWPQQGQADFLAPKGYTAIYQTNAITKHGEHGNALLTRWRVLYQGHEDISDHRFEQRGLLHVALEIRGVVVHVIVVHLGLIGASRMRQVQQLHNYIAREIPPNTPLLVAGDFNDWSKKLERYMRLQCLYGLRNSPNYFTYPARLPLAQLDHIYARKLERIHQFVPKRQDLPTRLDVVNWAQLSDHLPLVAEFCIP